MLSSFRVICRKQFRKISEPTVGLLIPLSDLAENDVLLVITNLYLIHQEQVEWAVQEGADFIVGETFSIPEEAEMALHCIKKYGNGKLLSTDLILVSDNMKHSLMYSYAI